MSLATALISSSLLLVGCSANSTEPLGDFLLPAIGGWERSKKELKNLSAVRYKKRADGGGLNIAVLHETGRVGRAPKGIVDLQNEVAAEKRNSATLSKNLNSAARVQYQPTTSISLHGLPAVETRSTIKTSEEAVYEKSIHFSDGRDSYVLRADITTPANASATAPPALQAEMDEALAQVMGALKP